MIKEREFLKKYQIDPINICYKNNSKIITAEDGKYTIKVRIKTFITILEAMLSTTSYHH